MNLPKALKIWRAKHGLTQEAAAKNLGVKLASFRHWEYGERNPSSLAKTILGNIFKAEGISFGIQLSKEDAKN